MRRLNYAHDRVSTIKNCNMTPLTILALLRIVLQDRPLFHRRDGKLVVIETIAATAAGTGYRADLLLRFFGSGAGRGSTRTASAASLVSRRSRSRAMFFRMSVACLSTSNNARAPSSAASLLRLMRAMLSGDGSASFLALISHHTLPQTKPAQSGDRAGRMAVSVHP